MKKDLRNLVVVQVSVGVLIFIYFHLVSRMNDGNITDNDPLNKKVMSIDLFGKNCCSIWPISHFVMYAVLAYIWPQYWKQIFAMGVGWECIEWVQGYLTTPDNEEVTFKNTRLSDGSVEYEQWWSSSSKDIIFNAAGITCGLLVKTYLRK